MARTLRLAAALVGLAAGAAAATAQAPPAAGLGLCPDGSKRLDEYAQALCAGEAALRAGDLPAAIERFRFAAALPRADASNELAWAGLAAAHCRAQEFDAGRQWASHFSQARRLWFGELDCAAAGDDPRAQLGPFVRSRMCGERLAADYAIVRGGQQTAHAIDLRRRLEGVDAVLAAACAAAAAAPKPAGAARDGPTVARKKAAHKRGAGRAKDRAPAASAARR
jgi:hypothetical protein